MKKPYIVVLLACLLFGGFSLLDKSENNCVNLYVSYGSETAKVLDCIPASSTTNALDLLSKANFVIEGTQKYGSAVVCRVNNFPDNSVEKCITMPPSNAYWAVLIKKKQLIPFPPAEWGWAQKGINELYLEPGESLGLVFAENGEVKFP